MVVTVPPLWMMTTSGLPSLLKSPVTATEAPDKSCEVGSVKKGAATKDGKFGFVAFAAPVASNCRKAVCGVAGASRSSGLELSHIFLSSGASRRSKGVWIFVFSGRGRAGRTDGGGVGT